MSPENIAKLTRSLLSSDLMLSLRVWGRDQEYAASIGVPKPEDGLVELWKEAFSVDGYENPPWHCRGCYVHALKTVMKKAKAIPAQSPNLAE